MDDRRGFLMKLRYRFDTLMAKSPLGLIKIIAAVTVAVALLLTVVMVIGGSVEEGGFGGALWETLSTEINAWMPSSEDGDALYVLMMAVAAIVGLMITSVLIGIISGAIEEKLNGLRRGNSLVMESGHTVVLGFVPGEYTLINELIASAGTGKEVIVIAGDTDKEEADEAIRENIDCPKNIRIIYRTADICDPVSMKCLSIDTARSVAVTPMDDVTTLRSLFALCRIIDGCGRTDISISASLSDDYDGSIPESTTSKRNITVIHTGDVLSRIIAHSCTQPGLSRAFAELLDFSGSELYDLEMPDLAGKCFGDIIENLRGGVPVGIISGGNTTLCPEKDTVFSAGDRLIVFAENKDSVSLASPAVPFKQPGGTVSAVVTEPEDLLVIGCSGDLATILYELPEKPFNVVLAGSAAEHEDEVKNEINREDIIIESFAGKLTDENLFLLCEKAEHAVLLNSRGEDADEDDLEVMVMLTRLRDIRESRGLRFSITAELQREHNRRLVSEGELTDYVVAGDMAALTLAQMTRNPALQGTFRTLLSNEGSELYLVPVSAFGFEREAVSLDIRRTLYGAGYIFLGYFNENGAFFDPPFDEKVSLSPGDQFIVIGEKDI